MIIKANLSGYKQIKCFKVHHYFPIKSEKSILSIRGTGHLTTGRSSNCNTYDA